MIDAAVRQGVIDPSDWDFHFVGKNLNFRPKVRVELHELLHARARYTHDDHEEIAFRGLHDAMDHADGSDVI